MKRSIFILLVVAALPISATARQNPFEALKKGMELHSDSLMRVFFDAWYDSSNAIRVQPATELQKMTDTIVKVIWDPSNYHTLLWGWTNDTISPRKLPPYIILWPVIKIFSDSLKSSEVDSFSWMSPKTLWGSRVLLFQKNFADSIRKYLIWKNPNRSNDIDYLLKFVALSHQMGGYGIVSEPNISSVASLNKGKTAIVSFGMAHQGLEETISSVNGKWILVHRYMDWIE